MTSVKRRYSARSKKLVVFSLGGEDLYGAEVTRVQRVAEDPLITALPLVPQYILGMISIQGSIIPIVDLKKILGLPDSNGQSARQIVILKDQETLAGIVVNRRSRVIEIASDDAVPAKALEKSQNDFVETTLNWEGRALQILNVKKLIADTKLGGN